MDTLKTAIQLLTPDCWFASVDLKDAYYSVNVEQQYRKYLRFLWKGECFEFKCLPMGLTSSPRVFTKLLKPVFSNLHKFGFSSLIYIDDTLLHGNTYEECKANVNETVKLLDKLGFTIHPSKSVLEPSQQISFLGFLIDSVKMTVKLLPEKAEEIEHLCFNLQKKHEIKIRDLAKVIGKLVASEPGVSFAPLHYKLLKIEKDKNLKLNKGNFDAKMTLSLEAKGELMWWFHNIRDSFKCVEGKKVDFIMQTDSSNTGWGAVVIDNELKTGGHWSYVEQKSHINILELKAVLLALQSFFSAHKDIHICIQMDNMVSVSYLNNMGGRKPEFNNLCRIIWEWCIQRNIYLSAKYLPGVQNIQADRLSRKLNDDLEWKLNEQYFNIIKTRFHLDNAVDMFASRLNYQLEKYVSFLPDPNAIAVDAFTMTWKSNIVYLFPPFSVIGQVLNKIEMEKAEAVLIAPIWPTQVWFGKLLHLICEQSYIIPRRIDTLIMPTNKLRRHPLRKMYLGCFRLSGNYCKTKEFQTKLLTQSQHPGDDQHKNNIGVISKNGCNFVLQNKVMPLKHL